MNKIAFGISFAILAIGALIYFAFKSKSPFGTHPEAVDVEIVEQWDLPIILEEISGIDYIDENRLAAVQDEEGIIFIYGLKEKDILRQIPFGEMGDYEGIALVGSTAYVLRSDGAIIEVENFLEENRKTTIHDTGLDATYDCEGLCYDASRDRLLVAIKDKDGDEFKPIFSFDLATKSLQEEPAYKIFYDDPVFEKLDQKLNHTVIRPTEINIHPQTGEIYILDGKVPKLLILDTKGKPVDLHIFNELQFPQAEGLTFSPEGDLYISNESKNKPPNILKINLSQ